MVKHPMEGSPAASAPVSGWGQASRGAALPLLGMALFTAWAGVAGAAIAPGAAAKAGSTHGFNFAYQPEGGRAAAPTQVFDDGQHTYMQFNALDRVPELWSDEADEHRAPHRISFHLESPYVVIDQVLPRLRLVLDGQATVLVNQGWKSHAGAARAAANHAAPRIWTDRTAFGPEEPPGPVATARSARPSHDLPRGNAPATSGAKAPSDGEPRRVALGAEEDNGDEGPAAEADASTAPAPDREQAAAELAARPFTSADPLAEAHLQAMRAQAIAMIAHAHDAGDNALEQRLRRIFSEIAQAPVAQDKPAAPPGHGRDARWQHGPLLALAETRPRTDVPLRDEPEAPAATPGRYGAAGGAPADAGAVASAAPAGAGSSAASAPAAGAAGGRNASGTLAEPAPGAAGAAGGNDAQPRQEALVFEVRDNQRLSQALGHFLETLGWRLEWESQSDFVVRRGYVVRAPTLKQVLLQTLGEYRLSAVLYSGNLVVAVTGGDR